MIVLVTGGSGFLGSHIAEQLSQGGHTARCLVRKSSNAKFLASLPNVELAYGDVDDAESLTRAVSGVDAVIHSAGLVKARTPDEFFNVNTRGTEKLLDAAISAGVKRFVLVSSLTVAGPSNDRGDAVPEDAPERPLTAYARSKLAGERAAQKRKSEIELVVLRPPALYGPRDREVLAFFKAVEMRVLPYMGAPTQKVSMLHGADCASACIAALSAQVPSGSTYYLEDGVVYAFQDLVNAVEGSLGKRAWLRVPLPRPLIRAAAFASEQYGKLTNQAVMLTRDKCNELFNQWVCDGSRARKELGWTPKYSITEGVAETAQWYREHGWL